MLRGFLDRFRRRRGLRRYLSKDLVDLIMSDKLGDEPPRGLSARRIEIVVAAVRGETADEVARNMAEAADLAYEHKGIVDCMVSSLVVVVFGVFVEAGGERGRLSFVKALAERLGPKAKIVHGACAGHFGDIGDKTCVRITFIVPGFPEALRTLADLGFGEVREVELVRGEA